MDAKEVFSIIETDLKSKFKDAWESNKGELEGWTLLLVALQADSGKNKELAKKYAEIGLSCLKTRLQFKLEEHALEVIMTSLGMLLKAAIAFSA